MPASQHPPLGTSRNDWATEEGSFTTNTSGGEVSYFVDFANLYDPNAVIVSAAANGDVGYGFEAGPNFYATDLEGYVEGCDFYVYHENTTDVTVYWRVMGLLRPGGVRA